MGGGFYQVLLVASIVAFGAMLGVYMRSGRASMFHPATLYLAFHFVVFVVRPILVFYRGYDRIYGSFQFQPTIEEKAIALIGANLGMIVFVLGCLYFGRALPRLRPVSNQELDGYVKPVLLTSVILGIPGLWSLYTVLGMTSLGTIQNQWEMDLATGTTINTTSNGYLIEAQLMLATLGGMIAYVFRFRWWSLLPFLTFVLLRAGTGGRGPFISAAFFVILLYLFANRRKWLTGLSLAIGAAGLLLFRIVGDYRKIGFDAVFGSDPRGEQVTELRFLESMDWGNIEFFEYIVHVVPKRTGTYDYFASMLQLFTEPIPRVLWSDKPIGAPIKFFNMHDYGRPVGMTYSLPGSGWLELGWAGIVIMCLAFAWLYGKAYDKFMNGSQSPFSVMLYAAFMMSAIVAYRDGLILTVARQSLFFLAPVIVAQGLAISYGAVPRAPWRPAIPAPPEIAPPEALSPRERRRLRAAMLDRA
jgi:oligosaccharide repeat unit polymerase